MRFDSSGNLLVASGGILDSPGHSSLLRIAPDGSSSVLASGLDEIRKFTLDAAGNVVFASYVDGAVYRVSPQGQVSFLGSGTNGPGPNGGPLVESIALTPGGDVLLGVNTGADGDGNTNRLDRFDPVTGQVVTLGINFTSRGGVGYRLPEDMEIDPATGELLIAAFGSLSPLALSGNLDMPTSGLTVSTSPVPAVPPWASACLLATGLVFARQLTGVRKSQLV
jgi:hypothetical protein